MCLKLMEFISGTEADCAVFKGISASKSQNRYKRCINLLYIATKFHVSSIYSLDCTSAKMKLVQPGGHKRLTITSL